MTASADFFQSLCNHSGTAIIYGEDSYSYAWLQAEIESTKKTIQDSGVEPGQVVQLLSDFKPKSVAFLFAMIQLDLIVCPLTGAHSERVEKCAEITGATYQVVVDGLVSSISKISGYAEKQGPLKLLRDHGNAGLIIMSSGSSGQPKAVVHSADKLLSQASQSKKNCTVLSCLTFDHIGGLNVIFNNLKSGNTLVVMDEVAPSSVGRSLSNNGVNVLVCTPSFLNLMFLQGAFLNHQPSVLYQINCGGEVVPVALRNTVKTLLPGVKLVETYGLSELGVTSLRSSADGGLTLPNNRSGNYRVRDEKLEIKSDSSMLGYLNAADPFTADGWFKTGDLVEMDGNKLRILGRESDIINVAGQKVFPAEVEQVLLKMNEVADVAVFGEPHPMLGQVIKAKVQLKYEANRKEFIVSMNKFCKDKIAAYMVPQKIELVDLLQYGVRHKKIRG